MDKEAHLKLVRERTDSTKNKLVVSTVTQHTNDGQKGPWIVQYGSEPLWELPIRLSVAEAMNILHFAREYEEKGFQNGIEFTKNVHTPKVLEGLRSYNAELEIKNKLLAKENERLANILEKEIYSES